MLDLWYKNAIIYCLDVRTFMDSDGNGIGDFQGLTDRLDYIESLGANCIWLLPFYPSPNRDNGYDVSDYYGVDSRLGTPGDFVSFTRNARNRGIRVIVDLVVNHTSVDHAWFQAVRDDPRSRYRDYYIWSDKKPENADQELVFPGVQQSTWTWDEAVGAFYFHSFYAHQPDLNIENPDVWEEIQKVMGYWLELGVSGFRIDAVPFLIEHNGIERRPLRNPYGLLNELHQFLSWRKAGAIVLGEANVTLEEAKEYFGDGNRLKMMFNFLLNQQTFLAFARMDAEPMVAMLKAAPELPDVCQWATFLRNHDELDLGRLDDDERQEVFDAFAPEENMRLYRRGIRRRLAPMFRGDRRRLEMAFSLMLALPGTPVIWYGDELGMGEDLSLSERNAVRTPMPWNDGPKGGFSEAPADQLLRPVLVDGPFGCESISVAAQSEDPASLLEKAKSAISTRRSCPEVGWGRSDVIDTGESSVLALRHRWRGNEVMTVHNISDRDVTVRLGPLREATSVRLMLGEHKQESQPKRIEDVCLPAYGYRWYRLSGERR